MNNENGQSLVTAMISLLLSSLLLTEINKNLILAIRQSKLIKDQGKYDNPPSVTCGKITKANLTWECKISSGKKRITVYEN